MPCDIKKYPANWDNIRKTVLLRAGGHKDDPRIGARCEWCHVLNYGIGYRQNGTFYYAGGNIYYDDFQYATNYAEARETADFLNEWEDEKYIVVVLTIAHIHDPNPMNVDLSNLAALCQHCHNRHDMKMRTSHRIQGRFKNQMDLFVANNSLQATLPAATSFRSVQLCSGGQRA